MRLPVPHRAQLGTGALVIAALSVGQVLVEHLPSHERAGRAFERQVAVDQTVTLRTGKLTVTGVDAAREVRPEQGDHVVSPGLVLVVTFDFTPSVPETSISYGELRDSGKRVTTLSVFGARSVITCPQPPVGIRTHCTALVEADPSTLAGARLALGPSALDPRFDDMAVADLGITKSDVEEWKDRSEPLDVPAPAVAGMS